MKKFLSLLLIFSTCISFLIFAISCGTNKDQNSSENDESSLDSKELSEVKKPDTPDKQISIEDCQKIVVEIAQAYDRKGGKIPYEMSMRRSEFSSPEDATSQRTIFLDCSSYVNSCYREGFGANILPFESDEKLASTANYDEYAKNNVNNSDVIGYWIPSDYPTSEDKTALVDWIYNNLQVGDILTYRHGKKSSTSGHTYIYIGNNTFMHCAGAGSYVVNSKNPALSHDSNANEVNGTIDTISSDAIFKTPTHKRYIFKSTATDTVFSFSIIRPFARGLTPTQESLNRMKISGLSMEKTSSVCENAAVFSGSHLTYTITLENTGKQLSSVTISDTVPNGTAFVSGDDGVTVSNGKISWTGDIPSKTTVKINYTVEITENKPGSKIISNETYVSGVKLGCITHTVSSLTVEKQAIIAQTAMGYVTNGNTFNNSLEMVKSIYASHGIDLFDYNTVKDVLNSLIDNEKLTHHTSTSLSDILVPNLYGGISIENGWRFFESENDKTRLPKEEHLCVGDIIFADWSGGSVVYFYAGNKTLITVQNGVCKALTIGDNIFVEGDNILISLLGYNRYAVIRPGMRDINMENIISISITQQPNKLNYDNGEKFDSDGMVVTATMSDKSQKILSSYEISPDILTPDVTFVTVSIGDIIATVNVSVSENKHVSSISEASKLSVGEVITVEGIVVGVAHEGLSNESELLIKDLNDDTVIAVRNLSGSFSECYGYKTGDIITFKATVKKDTSSSTCYKLKKYLEFSAENVTLEKTIVSRGNKISYTFKDVVEIESWDDVQNFFVKSTNTPYTYLKIKGGFYVNYYKGKDTDNYRIHNNDKAVDFEAIMSDGTALVVRDDVMEINIGTNWKEVFSFDKNTLYPGTLVEKDIYVLYIGGNNSYYQLVILDENWIS